MPNTFNLTQKLVEEKKRSLCMTHIYLIINFIHILIMLKYWSNILKSMLFKAYLDFNGFN